MESALTLPSLLSRQERLQCYKVALDTLKYRKRNDQLKGAGACICPILVTQAVLLLSLKGIKTTVNNTSGKLLMLYPEYSKYKPKGLSKNEPWFKLNDFETRVNILKSLIKYMNNEISNHGPGYGPDDMSIYVYPGDSATRTGRIQCRQSNIHTSLPKSIKQEKKK